MVEHFANQPGKRIILITTKEEFNDLHELGLPISDELYDKYFTLLSKDYSMVAKVRTELRVPGQPGVYLWGNLFVSGPQSNKLFMRVIDLIPIQPKPTAYDMDTGPREHYDDGEGWEG